MQAAVARWAGQVSVFVRNVFPEITGFTPTKIEPPRQSLSEQLKALLETKRVQTKSFLLTPQARVTILHAQMRALRSVQHPSVQSLMGDMNRHLLRAQRLLHFDIPGINQRVNEELRIAEADLAAAYTDLLFIYLGDNLAKHLQSAPFGLVMFDETTNSYVKISLDKAEERAHYFEKKGIEGFTHFFAYALAQRYSSLPLMVTSYPERLTLDHFRQFQAEFEMDLDSSEGMLAWIESFPALKISFVSYWNGTKGRHTPLAHLKNTFERAHSIVEELRTSGPGTD